MVVQCSEDAKTAQIMFLSEKSGSSPVHTIESFWLCNLPSPGSIVASEVYHF